MSSLSLEEGIMNGRRRAKLKDDDDHDDDWKRNGFLNGGGDGAGVSNSIGSSKRSRIPSFRTISILLLALLLFCAPSPLRFNTPDEMTTNSSERGPREALIEAEPDSPLHASSMYDEPPKTISKPEPNSSRPSLKTCQVCSSSDPLCRKWGSEIIQRSRAFRGSLRNMKSFLQKIRQGKDVKIGIIGGSISACIDSTKEDCYVTRLAKQLTKDWGVNVEIVNGASSGMGSGYFESCWTAQITVPVDLVIIELSVNDIMKAENPTFDALLRSVLSHETKPAVMLLSLWSPLGKFAQGGPQIEHLAQYYNVPIVAWRQLAIHHRRLNPPTGTNLTKLLAYFSRGEGNSLKEPGQVLWQGGHHPGPKGHEMIADLVEIWFRYERCVQASGDDPEVKGKEEFDFPLELPQWSAYAALDAEVSITSTRHKCYSATPGLSTAFPISANAGWQTGQWKNKYYLVAHEPGAHVIFDVVVPPTGFVMLMYWRSKVLKFGSAMVWFDDDEDATVMLRGSWEDFANLPQLASFKQPVHLIGQKRKMHVLVMDHTDSGKHEFRISTLIF